MPKTTTTLLILAFSAALSAQSVPRAEFPQPQFQRADWMTLNGPWQFEFDDRNAGQSAHWYAAGHALASHITVPYCFESKLSGIADTSFHPWIWYRRTFEVPADWKSRRVLLHFGAVFYQSDVWVNGEMAGSHEGGNTPFVFDVTPLLKPGANVVTLRAWDAPEDRYVPRGKQYWEPKSRSIFYTRTSGIWQPVWLEATGDSYLKSVRITPTVDGNVRFDASVARPDPALEFAAVVSATGSVAGKLDLSRSTLTLHVNEPRIWSTGNPQLYDVTFELRHGSTVLDRVTSYFGFRSVAAEEGKVLVNDHPVFLKFILDQGYWPESIMTPPSDEAMQYDIRLSQAMGFNGARKHQKLEDPRFLYWADKMGYLISSEMANAYLFDDQYVERFTKEWTESVERDYNHPSIIMWVPLNESWGVPNLHDPRQQNHQKEMYALSHALDDTRLVIDNDGWEHTNMTDLFAIHDYARTGEMLLARYKDMGFPAHSVPNNAKRSLIPGYSYNGSPVYLSEFGGIAFIPAGHEVPAESWGYSGVEKTPEAALDRLRGLYTAIAQIPAIAGVCYTQLTDVEQEVNGLLTYDRKPKFDVARVKQINELVK